MSSDANLRTVEAYEGGVQAYIENTAPMTYGSQKDWLDRVFYSIGTDASILEIGAAFGRDATYLKNEGFNVSVSDGTPAFVEYLNSIGFDAKELNIIEYAPSSQYEAILALAVFLHFTEEDFNKALEHVCDGLKVGGKFIFTLMLGEGEKWESAKLGAERYFHYWKPEEVYRKLGAFGFSIVKDESFVDDVWMYLVGKKVA